MVEQLWYYDIEFLFCSFILNYSGRIDDDEFVLSTQRFEYVRHSGKNNNYLVLSVLSYTHIDWFLTLDIHKKIEYRRVVKPTT